MYLNSNECNASLESLELESSLHSSMSKRKLRILPSKENLGEIFRFFVYFDGRLEPAITPMEIIADYLCVGAKTDQPDNSGPRMYRQDFL